MLEPFSKRSLSRGLLHASLHVLQTDLLTTSETKLTVNCNKVKLKTAELMNCAI